jgi:hypothetical protein
MLLAKELLPGQKALAWASGALLVTSPTYIIFGRFGTEVTSLVPAMIFFGLWLVVWAGRRPEQKRANVVAVAGGLIVGLATYTHVIAACVPFAIAFTVMLVQRTEFFKNLRIWLSGVGFIVGCSPLFIISTRSQGRKSFWGSKTESITSGEFLTDLSNLPGVILDSLNGQLLYLRFTGEIDWPVVPYVLVALGIVVGLRIISFAKVGLTRTEVIAFGSSALFIFVTFAISPRLSPRYFLYFELATPLLVSLLASSTLRAIPSAKKLLAGVAVSFSVLSLAYVGNNYFAAFARSGGKCSVFALGERLMDTSNHFVRVDKLYDQLVEAEVEHLYTGSFIGWTIDVLDRGKNQLKFYRYDPGRNTPHSIRSQRGKVAIVFYNGPMTTGGRRVIDWFVDIKKFKLQSRVFKRVEKAFDPNFIVFFTPEL